MSKLIKNTLSYSDGVKGWPSFYSFEPEYMTGMNSYFYSFKGGNLYRHNTNETRNTYYGVFYPSSITGVFNIEPMTIKLFKTMSFESDAAWECTNLITDLGTGSMNNTDFIRKEGEWFTYIREKASTLNFKLRSANGIGNLVSSAPSSTAGRINLTFDVSVGSILSGHDDIYYVDAISGNVRVGHVTGINQATKTIEVFFGITFPAIPNNVFVFFYKNVVAESHGARGYFMEFTLENDSTLPVELFSVGSNLMKSYP